MDMPPTLRAALDSVTAGVSTERLAAAAAVLSARYRAETRDGRMHVAGDEAALAYCAARLPATYAATRLAMAETAQRLPAFAPTSQLDLGAGPGTASFAAADGWPSLERAILVEASAAMRAIGGRIAGSDPVQRTWLAQDMRAADAAFARHDLVTLCYVLDELEPAERNGLVAAAWRATASLLLIVEPGTPAGWQRILIARDALVAAGAHIAAPCPHEAPCPLTQPDWCHFAARLARSRLHQRTKQAQSPFEDEKFLYLAASRLPPADRPLRVLAPPKSGSGRVALKLCAADGRVGERLVTRRDGDIFRSARRLDWGDAVMLGEAESPIAVPAGAAPSA